MVHVVDADEELMWTDDHDPPMPTSQWKPGQTVEYTRTIFVPIYPYVGEATIQVGLYSTQNAEAAAAGGRGRGTARVQGRRRSSCCRRPRTSSPCSRTAGIRPRVAEHNAMVEWQWTKKDATLAFRNPKKDCVFYLDLDNPGSVFHEPQQVQVSLGGQTVDEFTLSREAAAAAQDSR